MDSARHVIGCHSTEESRFQTAFVDAVSSIHQSLSPGAERKLRLPEDIERFRDLTMRVTYAESAQGGA